MNKRGIKINHISPDSTAYIAGIKEGDRIISINRHTIKDPIDLMFYGDSEVLNFVILRDGKTLNINVFRDNKPLGIEVEPFKIKRCRNRCLFCFVEQLPRGLRKSLYVKDEDYRASFLYGNYITLTNLTKADYERIKKMRLSPLYISVHTVNPELRNIMLGNYDAPPIIHELKKLAKMKIRMHTQVVLCPDVNDGEELEKTILELHRLYPYVSSVAVVPVGLTKYHKRGLNPVDSKKAREIINLIEPLQKRFRKKHGIDYVYLADEFYIKAGKTFPPVRHYDDFPQIENGVGMVPLFMERAMKIHIPHVSISKRLVTFTGHSFYPYLYSFIERMRRRAIPIELYPLRNTLFGDTVTVTGLLSGEDIIKGLSPYVESGDILLIPDVTMRDSEDMFIDSLTVQDIEAVLNIKISKIGTEPEDLLKAIKNLKD